MRKLGNFRCALILVMLSILVPTHTTARGDEDREKAAVKAYKNAYVLLLDKEYVKAQEQFAGVLKQYSDTRVYDDASYWYCYASEKATRNLEKAFACYEDFLKNCPRSKWREEAMENLVRIARVLSKTDPQYKTYLRKFGRSGEYGGDDWPPHVLEGIIESGEEDVLFDMYDQTENVDTRRRIVQALSECESQACIEKLAAIVRKEADVDTRRYAVYALSECETPFCMEQLMEVVKNDPDTDIRRQAIYALSEFENEETVIKLMVEILKSEQDVDIRRHAVYSIVEAKQPSAIPTLIDIALNEKDKDTARAAVYGLAEFEDPRAAEALVRVLKESTDSDARRAALYAVIERKDASMIASFKEIVESGKDHDLVMAAVWAITEMEGEPEAARALIDIYKSSDDKEVRKNALYGIARNDDAGLGAELLKEAAVSATDEDLAKVAIHTLVDKLEDDDAGLLLEVYEKSPFPEVRKTAFFNLLEIGVDQAMPVIKKILKTEVDPDMRTQVVWALEEAGDEEEAVRLLAETARHDPSSKVRRAALQVLGEIDTESARQSLRDIYRERVQPKDKE